jgi:hypothetical protein
MYPEDSAAGFDPRTVYVPAFVCAIISVAMIRMGALSFLFLVPLGYTAAAYNPAAAWLAFLTAAILNGGVSFGFSVYYNTGPGGLAVDVLHYTVTALGFTWIMAGGDFPRVRTLYRFIAAAVAGALAFLCVAYITWNSEHFAGVIRSQAEWLSSVYISASGADAVRRSFLEQVLTPEKVMAVIAAAALRGGALASAFFLLFINREAAFGMARLFRRRRRSAQGLSGFHVPANAIWVLSFSLAAVLLARAGKLEVVEVVAWNILALCAILFLAQGGGIALYTLTRRPLPPPLRLLCNILIVVAIFSPGINTVALGLLILLGIAENWLPLRAPKHG